MSVAHLVLIKMGVIMLDVWLKTNETK